MHFRLAAAANIRVFVFQLKPISYRRQLISQYRVGSKKREAGAGAAAAQEQEKPQQQKPSPISAAVRAGA